MLYAAQIRISENRDALVASGTVFNEIQLWHPSGLSFVGSHTTITPASITKRLKGHEGCIFSLRFNEEGNMLASCSDDRTIRVWDVKEGTCLVIGFAHIARVWDVRFLPSNPEYCDGNTFLLSNSEDTTALLWKFSPSVRKLCVQERYHGHGGKHVWSQAISSDGMVAATGGNDGTVNIWDISGWRNRIEEGSDVFWKEKPLKVSVDGKERLDSIKGYCCVDKDRLLLTTNSGYRPIVHF